jgi:hypothetical protein
MKLQLIRSATLKLHYGGHLVLIDFLRGLEKACTTVFKCYHRVYVDGAVC